MVIRLALQLTQATHEEKKNLKIFPAVLLVLDCMEREIFGMCSCQLTTWETFMH